MSEITLKSIGELLDQKLDQKLAEQDKRFDRKLTRKLKPIWDELKEIRGALNPTIRKQEYHAKRIDRLDDHLGLEHLTESLHQ